jgi:hypothetical protein
MRSFFPGNRAHVLARRDPSREDVALEAAQIAEADPPVLTARETILPAFVPAQKTPPGGFQTWAGFPRARPMGSKPQRSFRWYYGEKKGGSSALSRGRLTP